MSDNADYWLRTVPDAAWNHLLDGRDMDCIRVIRNHLSVDLRHALLVIGKMRELLGMLAAKEVGGG